MNKRVNDRQLLGNQQEGDSILQQAPGNQPYDKDYSSRLQEQQKSLIGRLGDQLDKILAVFLVILLLIFFLQSSGQPKKKLTKQALLDTSTLQTSFFNNQSTNSQQNLNPDQDLNPGEDRTTLQSLIKQNDDPFDNFATKKGNSKSKEENYVETIFNEEDSTVKIKNQEITVEEQQKQADSDLEELKYKPHRRRTQFFKDKEHVQHLQRLKLAKYNLITPDIDQDEREVLIQEERQQLEAKYKMSEFSEELSICVVAHASSHKKPYAHEYLINSILSQDYQHFIVIYVADGFAAEDVQPIKQFIRTRDPDRRVRVVWNQQKRFFLESTINAIKSFCMEQRVTVLIDGDDELLGTQVFKVLNTLYRRHSANLVYGNFIEYHQIPEQIRLGFATEYQDNQKRENKYRSIGQKFGMLKSFKTRLISFIKDSDLKDSFGNYYRYAGDYALMYPLLELSCGQVRYMAEFNYLYFGYQIDPTYGSLQISNGRAIREKNRYDCFRKYK